MNELSMSVGETLEILKLHESGWMFGRKRNGLQGWLPVSYCSIVDWTQLRVPNFWIEKVKAWQATGPTVPNAPYPTLPPSLPPKKRNSATMPLAPNPHSELHGIERLEAKSSSPTLASPPPVVPSKPSTNSLRGSRRSKRPPEPISEVFRKSFCVLLPAHFSPVKESGSEF